MSFGIPSDEQLAKINKLAKRTLSKDEVFVFPSKLAGDMIIPNRHIQLQKSLLDVYANDAKKGVSLLLDHSWSPDGFFGMGGRPKAALPYGRTFDSRYETSLEEGETISLVGDHYMVKGVEIDGIKTDDLASSIEAGTLFDTSIGFGFNKSTCSVCGEDYRNSSKCKHIAGRTYEVEGEDGVTRNKFCYIKAEPPGYLMENSLVFDGAYPGAGVLSNAGDVGENEYGVFEVVEEFKDLDPNKNILSVYSNHRGITTLVKKSDHKKIYGTGGIIGSPSEIHGNNLGEGEYVFNYPQFKDLAKYVAKEKANGNIVSSIDNSLNTVLKGCEGSMNEKVLDVLKSLGIKYKEGDKFEDILNEIGEKFHPVVDEALGVVRAEFEAKGEEGKLSDEYLGIPKKEIEDTLGADFDTNSILKLAKEGQEYHKSLSDEAIAMGVRAMGNAFPAETWEKNFAKMSTKEIKDIMKTWELQANAEIPAGRKTDPQAGEDRIASLPDDAYKVD